MQNEFETIQNKSAEVLNSWKEIAAYLDRGVRTAQRWEEQLGLPVRRPRGQSRSAVIALKSDLDAWLNTCPLNEETGNADLRKAVQATDPTDLPTHNELVLRSRALRGEIETTRASFQLAFNSLLASLTRMTHVDDPCKGETKAA